MNAYGLYAMSSFIQSLSRNELKSWDEMDHVPAVQSEAIAGH